MRDAILAGNENFSYATARAAEAKISLAPAAQGVGGEKAPSAAAGGAADKGRHCGVKRKLPTPAAAGKTKTAKVAVYGSQSKGPAKDQDQGKAKGKGKAKAAAKPAAAKPAAAAVPHAGKMCLAVSATGGSYGKASAALVHAWPY